MNTDFFKRQTAKLPVYWKLATVRCAIYAAIVGWSSFRAGLRGYQSFHDISPFDLWGLIGDTLVSMGGVWLAFLDQTMSRLQGNQSPPPPNAEANNNEPKS